MNNKITLSVLMAGTALLSGCINYDQPMYQTLPLTTPGIELSGSGKYTYLDSATFESTTEFTKDAVAGCIAENVSNEGHTLSSSTNYVGPATGRLYNFDHSRQVDGGDGLKFVGDDRVVADGSLSYTFQSGFVPISDIVRFTLSARKSENGTSYTFMNLKKAQQDTGIVANSGFAGVPMWVGGRSQLAYDALSDLHRKISGCTQ